VGPKRLNKKNGKTEYMIIGKFDEEMRTVSEKVKKGMISISMRIPLVGRQHCCVLFVGKFI
jgi:hypothetical protein